MVQIRAARLAELLWQGRGADCGIGSAANGGIGSAATATASDAASSSATPEPAASNPGATTAVADRRGLMSRMFSRSTDGAGGGVAGKAQGRATARTARVQLGKDILKDYETVGIGQSAYFTGAGPASACYTRLHAEVIFHRDATGVPCCSRPARAAATCATTRAALLPVAAGAPRASRLGHRGIHCSPVVSVPWCHSMHVCMPVMHSADHDVPEHLLPPTRQIRSV